MKRALIGGFLSILGAIGVLGVLLPANANLTSGWSTPPGRLLTTVSELGLTAALVISGLLLLLGVAAMVVEYFRPDAKK